ncbi:rhodopsin, GQ-coupled-like [Mya arenaria]|uniref:rhodopsin, GQ-coupled-like n=1 Tax=Mya arenaria TaxID=6604 RepID=UPI0022E1EB0A|nr:rhodopsin, GQ-coupled-like [Mya arenaria]
MNLIFTASTFTLVLIAIDRYMAVAKPLHYSMTMTSRRASFMIASVWISAILCSLPPLFGWNCYEFQLDKISYHIEPVVKTLSVLLALSSCAINPLVYVLRSKHIKAYAKKELTMVNKHIA